MQGGGKYPGFLKGFPPVLAGDQLGAVGTGLPLAERPPNRQHGIARITQTSTFVVPDGVWTVWISQCGGGGGGGGLGGGAGQGGGTGGTTSFGNYVSTPGGTGGASSIPTPPGTGGGAGGWPNDGYGGANPFSGQARRPTSNANGNPGILYGGGGTGAFDGTNSSSGGGAGQFVLKQPVAVTPGERIVVTIGAGGMGGDGATHDGGPGANGICIIEW